MDYSKIKNAIKIFSIVNLCLMVFFSIMVFKTYFPSHVEWRGFGLMLAGIFFYAPFLVIFFIFSIFQKNKKIFLFNFIFAAVLLLIIGYVIVPLTRIYVKSQIKKINSYAVQQGDVDACFKLEEGLIGFYDQYPGSLDCKFNTLKNIISHTSEYADTAFKIKDLYFKDSQSKFKAMNIINQDASKFCNEKNPYKKYSTCITNGQYDQHASNECLTLFDDCSYRFTDDKLMSEYLKEHFYNNSIK